MYIKYRMSSPILEDRKLRVRHSCIMSIERITIGSFYYLHTNLPYNNNNNNNNIYLKSSIQTSSIDYKNYYDMYKYNKYDYTNRSVMITNG